MSVKFEETIRTSGKVKGDLAHRVGERLTGGRTQTGYLAVRPTFEYLPKRDKELPVLLIS
jgi:hypothetical protein